MRLLGRLKQAMFRWCERAGVHVTPVHFYQPIPDTQRLPEAVWSRRSAMVGVDLREAAQLALAEEMATRWKSEYDAFPENKVRDGEFHIENGAFESIDAELLWCMIRRHRPRRMIEIGSGNSTLLAAQAHRKNAAEGAAPCEFIAIEPYASEVIRRGVPGLTRLIQSPVQNVPLEEFASLSAGDILFIDSSHVLKIDSDVQYEFLEILPRLSPGVIVHVHDIFLPCEYPRHWVTQWRLFWNEQYLLQAYLCNNSKARVLWAGYWMHVAHADTLRRVFGSYARNPQRSPGSFWFEVTG